MKKFNSGLLFKVCSLCIAMAAMMTTNIISYCFWGEPEYPTED